MDVKVPSCLVVLQKNILEIDTMDNAGVYSFFYANILVLKLSKSPITIIVETSLFQSASTQSLVLIRCSHEKIEYNHNIS